MRNINPLYLTEDHFWKKLGKYLWDDVKYTNQRYFGGRGKKYVRLGREAVSKNLKKDLEALGASAKSRLELDLIGSGKDAMYSKYANDIDNYLSRMGEWQNSKSEFGNEIKDLSGKAWDKVRGIFKRNPARNRNPIVSTYTVKPNGDIVPVAAVGLGALGVKTIADDPNIKIGVPDDKKRINPNAQRRVR